MRSIPRTRRARSGVANAAATCIITAWLAGAGLAGCESRREAGPAPSSAAPAAAVDDAASIVQGAPPAVSLDSYEFGGDFSLTDHKGRRFALADRRGKLGLLFFGYTMCPDVCPLTLSKVSQALEALGPARDEVEVFFVSVDVDRDTPQVLAKYIEGFGVSFTGLTGSRADVDQVVAQYRATYEITPSQSAGGPLVSHSTYTYLLDRQGRMRFIYRHGDPPAVLAEALKLAIAEPVGAPSSTTKAGEPLELARTTGPVTHVAVSTIGASRFGLAYVQSGSPATVWFAPSTADGRRLDVPVSVGVLEDSLLRAGGQLHVDVNAPLPSPSAEQRRALASAVVVQWVGAGRGSVSWRSTDEGKSFATVDGPSGASIGWRVIAPRTAGDDPSTAPPGVNAPLSAQRLERPSADAQLLAVSLDTHGALFGTWHEPRHRRVAVHRHAYDWTATSNRTLLFDIPVPVLTSGAAEVRSAAGAPFREGALVVWSRELSQGSAIEGRLVTLDLLCIPPKPSLEPGPAARNARPRT